jgi:hypothetical protein
MQLADNAQSRNAPVEKQNGGEEESPIMKIKSKVNAGSVAWGQKIDGGN